MVKFLNGIRVRFIIWMYDGRFVPEGGFSVDDIGFGMAFKWAKGRVHPYDSRKTLYDYACVLGSEPELMFRVINDIAIDYSQVYSEEVYWKSYSGSEPSS